MRCDAWHFRATSDALTTPTGRPVVVMAHGLAGTKDSGLQPFAEALAAAGLDVVAFDYRGFGASDGSPRQTVRPAQQLEDYRAAMVAAAALPDVDAQRLVLWGVSLSGGHVLAAAADRDDVAAVVSLTPLVDGRAAGAHALKHHTPLALVRSTAAGVRSRLNVLRGKPPRDDARRGPARPAGRPDSCGLLRGLHSIAGPTWVNEIDAAVGLEMGSHRPTTSAGRVRCPVLVQVADYDRSAPPHAAMKAAFAARAEVRHYPCDHFDVWPGKAWFDSAVAHQVSFLTRHLRPA